MSLDLDQLRADMEDGTPPNWTASFGKLTRINYCSNGKVFVVAGVHRHAAGNHFCNARRIARVPALEARVLSDAARIAAADALVATLLDFPTVHLERVYDLAEAYRATAPASSTSEGHET